MNSKTFALALLASFAGPAPSAEFANGNKVTLGGEDVVKIPGSGEEISPERLIRLAQDTLDNALVRASTIRLHQPQQYKEAAAARFSFGVFSDFLIRLEPCKS
jgi:hypothetical protein